MRRPRGGEMGGSDMSRARCPRSHAEICGTCRRVSGLCLAGVPVDVSRCRSSESQRVPFGPNRRTGGIFFRSSPPSFRTHGTNGLTAINLVLSPTRTDRELVLERSHRPRLRSRAVVFSRRRRSPDTARAATDGTSASIPRLGTRRCRLPFRATAAAAFAKSTDPDTHPCPPLEHWFWLF